VSKKKKSGRGGGRGGGGRVSEWTISNGRFYCCVGKKREKNAIKKTPRRGAQKKVMVKKEKVRTFQKKKGQTTRNADSKMGKKAKRK